jgi:hypothetical protein
VSSAWPHRLVRIIRELDKQWTRKSHPEARSVIVNARTPMNYATLAPIVEQLQRDDRIRLFLTSTEDASALASIYAEARAPFEFITPRVAGLHRFDAYLAADFIWLSLPRGSRRVQTFHGVAGKFRTEYDSPTRNMREWDRLFFINKHRQERFIASGAIAPDSPAARLIGMPRVDCLVDGSLRRDEILLALQMDPARNTVIYAPTWTAHSSLEAMGEEIVRVLGAAGFAVIVKLHDRSRQQMGATGVVDWASRLEPLVRATGGIIASGANASRYLAAADVMITDHSSVGFEFLLLNRPVIRVEMPELLARADIEPTYVELLASASTSIRNPGEVVAAVQQAFESPNRDREARSVVAEEMFFKPGGATQRAVYNLYEVLELEPPTALSRPEYM